MSNKPPCGVPGGCPRRWVTSEGRCHTNCKDSHDWRAECEAEKAAILAERKKESDVRIAHKPKVRLRKRHR